MKRFIKENLGVLLIIVFVIITIVLWYFSKAAIILIYIAPYRSVAQILGLVGVVLLSIDFFFPTRLKIVQELFGQLDKVYKVHHIIGGIAFAILLNHPVFLVISSLPSVQQALSYYLPWTDISYDVGISALYLMITLLLLTFFIKLPYHLWKMTHEYLSIVLLLAMIHVLLINSDTANSLLLKGWILTFIGFGLLCFIYTRFLYKKFGPHYLYSVIANNQYGEIIELQIKPIHQKMEFYPGQFVFISIQQNGITSEKHPFSISSSPDSLELRLGIKCLGDYTHALKKVIPGTSVNVFGPYGGFSNKFLIKHDDPEIWIAGGIGITPFISMLEYKVAHFPLMQVTLFYTVRTEEEAVYIDVLNSLAALDPSITIIPFYSSQKGHLSVQSLSEAGYNITDVIIFLCGPKSMMESLIDALTKEGVKPNNIQYEDFAMII